MNDELKEWKTQSAKEKIARLLMRDGISFSYNEEDGIVFTAPVFYVEKMKEILVNCYGCSQKPIINLY